MSLGSSPVGSAVKLPGLAWAIHPPKWFLSWVFTCGIDSMIHVEWWFYSCWEEVYMQTSLNLGFSHRRLGNFVSRWLLCLCGNGHPTFKKKCVHMWPAGLCPSKFIQLTKTYGWWPSRHGALCSTKHFQSATLMAFICPWKSVCPTWGCFISCKTNLSSSLVTSHFGGNECVPLHANVGFEASSVQPVKLSNLMSLLQKKTIKLGYKI